MSFSTFALFWAFMLLAIGVVLWLRRADRDKMLEGSPETVMLTGKGSAPPGALSFPTDAHTLKYYDAEDPDHIQYKIWKGAEKVREGEGPTKAAREEARHLLAMLNAREEKTYAERVGELHPTLKSLFVGNEVLGPAKIIYSKDRIQIECSAVLLTLFFERRGRRSVLQKVDAECYFRWESPERTERLFFWLSRLLPRLEKVYLGFHVEEWMTGHDRQLKKIEAAYNSICEAERKMEKKIAARERYRNDASLLNTRGSAVLHTMRDIHHLALWQHLGGFQDEEIGEAWDSLHRVGSSYGMCIESALKFHRDPVWDAVKYVPTSMSLLP